MSIWLTSGISTWRTWLPQFDSALAISAELRGDVRTRGVAYQYHTIGCRLRQVIYQPGQHQGTVFDKYWKAHLGIETVVEHDRDIAQGRETVAHKGIIAAISALPAATIKKYHHR